MNRHARRRQSAMDRHSKFYNDYVRHLPEAGPEVIGKPGVNHMVCMHDKSCTIYDGGACNCEPIIRFFAEPQRA